MTVALRDLKAAQSSDAPSRWMRVRVKLLGAVFFALLCALFTRAVQLQVHDQQKLKGLAQDQYVRESEIPARRGDIFDRRHVPLAQSVDVDSIWIDPSMLTEPKPAAKALAKALNVDLKELLERLGKARRFAWVKRHVTPADVAKVKELGLPGIGFAQEPQRFYPQRELAAHVIGLVGTDSRGLDGLELSFEDELSGDRVKRDALRDAKGRKLLTNGVEDPIARQGATLTLTIDRQLQYVTEKALSRAVEDAKAVAGMAVMLDPKTGELLAVANAPRFNPNTPGEVDKDFLRNRAVTDTFEPGSTFKSFVIAAALDAKAITESYECDSEKGAWVIGGHVVHDSHAHGTLKTREILQVSSNICAGKVAQRLGREQLVDAYQRFGFGERAGLGLPGEGKGVVPFPRAEITLATEAFGQGLTATAVQIAAGYGALANGGVLMRPYLVSKVVDPDGVVLLENQPTPVRRAVSEKAAKTVVSMLESVVEKEGTAPRARMDEYRVAGKTGTAQKVDPLARGYSEKRIASFIGMVPAENPRVVILVVIDEPKTDVYGGLVAAPAFKEIASAAMPYLAVPPSRAMPAPEPARPVARAAPERPIQLDAVTELSEALAAAEGREPGGVRPTGDGVRVPDLSGKTGRVAVAQLLGAALEPRLSGSGRVVSQHPAAGSLVDRGSRVTLGLAGNLPSSSR